MARRVLIGAIGLSLGLIVLAGLNIWAITPFKLVVVYSNSMQPTFKAGDIVIVRKRKAIHKGDVILFKYHNQWVLHRVVGLSGQKFITKGDANPVRDRGLIKPSQIKGVAIGVIPWIGRLSLIRGWFWYGFWGLSLMILGSLIFGDEEN